MSNKKCTMPKSFNAISTMLHFYNKTLKVNMVSDRNLYSLILTKNRILTFKALHNLSIIFTVSYGNKPHTTVCIDQVKHSMLCILTF